MKNQPSTSIIDHFGRLEDARIGRMKLNELQDIVVMAICTTICGADDLSQVELFGNAKLSWLRTFLELTNGIALHDTFGRALARLSPEQFQERFLEWVYAASDVTGGQVIAIDREVLRGPCDRLLGKARIAMVSACTTANHLVLGWVKVDDKSYESTAMRKPLQVLEFEGCIVAIDAIDCQIEIAQAIVDLDSDSLPTVKENQGCLHGAVEGLF
jgi:hypothetical protein